MHNNKNNRNNIIANSNNLIREMPICNKPATAIGNKSANEFDDHASEAAKVKRTREQAYYNSYDFDAIEVLPYDEDGDGHGNGGGRGGDAGGGGGGDKGNGSKGAGDNDDDDDDAGEGGDDDDDDGNDGKKQRRKNATMVKYYHKILPQQQQQQKQQQQHIAIHQAQQQQQQRLQSKLTNISQQHNHLQQQQQHVRAPQSNSSGVASSSDIASISVSASASASASSSNRSSGRSSYLQSQNNELQYTYLQRLGAFLVNTQHSGVGELSSDRQLSMATGASSGTAISGRSSRNGANATRNELIMSVAGPDASVLVDADNGNFLLPRAMLKYQSVGNTNSMPLTVITTASTTTGKHLQNTNANYNNSNNNKYSIANRENNILTALHHQGSKIRLNSIMTEEKLNATLTRKKKPSMSSTISTAGSIESHEREQGTMTVNPLNVVNNTASGIVDEQQEREHQKSQSQSQSQPQQLESEKRGRANSHQSHYSTEKSGSSGYYSSNVCSTYSLDDHIYCEPVIDILDLNSQSKSVVGGRVASSGGCSVHIKKAPQSQSQSEKAPFTALTKSTVSNVGSRLRAMNVTVPKRGNYATDIIVGRAESVATTAGRTDENVAVEASPTTTTTMMRKTKVTVNGAQLAVDSQPFSENLRILETSIENLDRHLKKYPSLSSQERIASFVQSHHTYLHHLPTIVEGHTPGSVTRAWHDDIEHDSLLDIDLDSFLLVNERIGGGGRKGMPRSKQTALAVGGGIDNPSFLTDELEENNLKCAKYINSCPEDAYRVESDIVAEPGTVSNEPHYPKRYEDQLHFQNTRELLEDVRDKIRLLSQSSNSELRSNSGDSHGALNEELPKELHNMIETLKYELESYLDRMNQHSELEIRQLCSGLVKNQHIVKMKKAFERRKSFSSSQTSLEPDYEAIRDGALLPLSGVPISIRQKIDSIRCASDPNFKLKRKSLSEVFPLPECYLETIDESARVSPSAPRGAHERERERAREREREREREPVPTTQMQRNLTFHKPVLNQMNTQIGPNSTGVGGGGLTGAGSGNESGDFGDKDSILEWHRKKPSIWEMYYGTNRLHQSLLGKRNGMTLNHNAAPTMSYPSSRPESDFTLDLPRAEQLRIKMEKEKKFRQRCRYITTFLSLVFFLLTVMVVSLVLTRGKRMFGSMI